MLNKIFLLSALALAITVGGWAVIYAQDSTERVYISSPSPGSTVSSAITVTGAAFGDNIRAINLYVVGSDDRVVAHIATARQGEFAVNWDTTSLPDGEYSIVLMVITSGAETPAFTVPYLRVLNEAIPTPQIIATPRSLIMPTQAAPTPAVDTAQAMILDTAIPDDFPDEIPTPYVPPFTDNTINLAPLEIAYVTDNQDRAVRYTLELYALDGRYGTRLVSDQRQFLDIGWSPDGTRIAYVLNSREDAPGALCMVYADSGQSQCFEEYPHDGDKLGDVDYVPNFAWSPDSRRIVYKLPGESGMEVRIRILDPDSGSIRTIATPDGSFDDPLFWIGDDIYFKGTRISPDGDVTVISEVLNDARGAWYSPDGHYALFNTGASLCLHNVATDMTLQCFTMQELVDVFGYGRTDETFLRETVFSPDGTRVGIIMTDRDEEADWYIDGGTFYGFVLDAGGLAPIPFEFDGDDDHVAWHPNNDALIGGGWAGINYQIFGDEVERIVHNEELANTTLLALRPINIRSNSVTVRVDPNVDAQIQLDNGAGVYIPAGSLSGEAVVSVEQNPNKAHWLPPIAEDMVPVSSFYDVRVEGAELVGPVALSFPIDGESLPLPPEATPFFQDENGQSALPTAEPTPPPVLVMAVPNDEGTAWDYVPLSERPYKGTERVTVWTDTLGDPLIAWHYTSTDFPPVCLSRIELAVQPDMIQLGNDFEIIGRVRAWDPLSALRMDGLRVNLTLVIPTRPNHEYQHFTLTTDRDGRFRGLLDGEIISVPGTQILYADVACHEAYADPRGRITFNVLPAGPITPTYTFTPTPTSSATPTPQPCEVRTDRNVQVRVGPGENRTSVAFMERNVWVPVLGQGGDDNAWWRVEPSIAAPHSLIEQAWVLKEGVEQRGNCSGGFIEEQAAPPIVPIRITITPTPSPTGVTSEERTYLIDFTVAPGVITEGQCTMLRWNAPEALSATLDGAPVATSDAMEACPRTDTRYAFTVQLPNGEQATRVVLVEVLPAEADAPTSPVSINFGATDQTIRQGECTALYWLVEGIDSVYYQGQPVIGQGESRECPTATTTYRLDVRLRTGELVARTLTIYVEASSAAPPPPSVEEFPQYTLVWYNANGDWGWNPDIIAQSSLVQINGPYYWWDCDEIGNEHARIVNNGQTYIIYSAWRDPAQNDAGNKRFRTDAYRLSDYERICR